MFKFDESQKVVKELQQIGHINDQMIAKGGLQSSPICQRSQQGKHRGTIFKEGSLIGYNGNCKDIIMIYYLNLKFSANKISY